MKFCSGKTVMPSGATPQKWDESSLLREVWYL